MTRPGHPADSAALGRLPTESRLAATEDLDVLSTAQVLAAMNAEDQSVPAAVGRVLPEVARAVDLVVSARERGGRLVYVGAGTSGRIGLLDAVECPPTFGTDPGEVVALLAGGDGAFRQAVEGAEDDPERGADDLREIRLVAADVVLGLAASGRTPYVLGALSYAREVGAATVSVACNPGAAISRLADVAIEVETGPEVLTGSTRLKAGSAQKLVCNLISTAVMVRSGKVFSNLMVDVRPTNAKLIDRARRIVSAAAGVDDGTAEQALRAAGGDTKTAVVLLVLGCSADEARDRLTEAQGRVRGAIAGASGRAG